MVPDKSFRIKLHSKPKALEKYTKLIHFLEEFNTADDQMLRK